MQVLRFPGLDEDGTSRSDRNAEPLGAHAHQEHTQEAEDEQVMRCARRRTSKGVVLEFPVPSRTLDEAGSMLPMPVSLEAIPFPE